MLHQSGGKYSSWNSCSPDHMISVLTLVSVGYVYKSLKNRHCDQEALDL
jgi:hypothetical protein